MASNDNKYRREQVSAIVIRETEKVRTDRDRWRTHCEVAQKRAEAAENRIKVLEEAILAYRDACDAWTRNLDAEECGDVQALGNQQRVTRDRLFQVVLGLNASPADSRGPMLANELKEILGHDKASPEVCPHNPLGHNAADFEHGCPGCIEEHERVFRKLIAD